MTRQKLMYGVKSTSIVLVTSSDEKFFLKLTTRLKNLWKKFEEIISSAKNLKQNMFYEKKNTKKNILQEKINKNLLFSVKKSIEKNFFT